MTDRPHARQQGSVAPMIAMGMMIMATVGIGGAAIGRIVAGRLDAQKAADAAALGIADTIRDQGIGAPRGGAFELAQHNWRLEGSQPLSWTHVVDEPIVENQAFVTTITVGAALSVQVPRFVAPSGIDDVRARASARIGEYVSSIDWQPSKLFFVLDFSGSMGAALAGAGGKAAIDVLKQSIDEILGWHLPIDYGANLFDSQLEGSEPFTDPTGGDVVAKIQQLLAGHTAGSGTATYLGMKDAYEIVRKENADHGPGGGFNVVLVSDGQPGEGEGGLDPQTSAYKYADLLRNGDAQTPPAELWAFHIDWSGGSDRSLRDFMVNMTGTKDGTCGKPSCHPDPDLYFPIVDETSLNKALAELLARIGCPVGPIDPAQKLIEHAPREIIHVFLRYPNGSETALERNDNVVGLATLNTSAWRWDEKRSMVYPTIKACQAISDAKARVVVRFNPAHLTVTKN